MGFVLPGLSARGIAIVFAGSPFPRVAPDPALARAIAVVAGLESLWRRWSSRRRLPAVQGREPGRDLPPPVALRRDWAVPGRLADPVTVRGRGTVELILAGSETESSPLASRGSEEAKRAEEVGSDGFSSETRTGMA